MAAQVAVDAATHDIASATGLFGHPEGVADFMETTSCTFPGRRSDQAGVDQ